jgi:hypothetical protein
VDRAVGREDDERAAAVDEVAQRAGRRGDERDGDEEQAGHEPDVGGGPTQLEDEQRQRDELHPDLQATGHERGVQDAVGRVAQRAHALPGPAAPR